jgi:glycine cleavage system regulatory protein
MGPDRPGLVAALARTLADYGATWSDCHLSCLGNQFAGIVLVHVPVERVVALEHELGELRNQGLRVGIDTSGTALTPVARAVRVSLTAPPQSDLIAAFAQGLSGAGANVEELRTRTRHAAFSTEGLVHADAEISLPESFSLVQLRSALEPLAKAHRAEIDIHEITRVSHRD